MILIPTAQESLKFLYSKRRPGCMALRAGLSLMFLLCSLGTVSHKCTQRRGQELWIGHIGVPACPWLSCPFSTWPLLPPYLAVPGSQCRKWVWAWFPVSAGPPLVTVLREGLWEIGSAPAHQAFPWGTTLWGLRTISDLHRERPSSSTTWRNSCPVLYQ